MYKVRGRESRDVLDGLSGKPPVEEHIHITAVNTASPCYHCCYHLHLCSHTAADSSIREIKSHVMRAATCRRVSDHLSAQTHERTSSVVKLSGLC